MTFVIDVVRQLWWELDLVVVLVVVVVVVIVVVYGVAYEW